MTKSTCRGITLIELLVTIGIIAILIAVLLPAVMYARAAARRSQCQNNLRQLGVALHNYAQEHGMLPPGAVISDLGNAALAGGTGPTKLGFLVQILPFIEQAELYNAVNLGHYMSAQNPVWPVNSNTTAGQRPVSTFLCPAEPTPPRWMLWPKDTDWRWAGTNYGGYKGSEMWPPNHGIDQNLWDTLGGGGLGGNGLFAVDPVRLSDIADGASHTLMLGEIRRDWGGADDGSFGQGARSIGRIYRMDTKSEAERCKWNPPPGDGWVTPPRGGSWMSFGVAGSQVDGFRTPNHPIPDCAQWPNAMGPTSGTMNARSHHTGGVHAAMADGAVRFISDHIDYVLYRNLCTRSAGDSVDLF